MVVIVAVVVVDIVEVVSPLSRVLCSSLPVRHSAIAPVCRCRVVRTGSKHSAGGDDETMQQQRD